ncbi:hypothetical protein EUX98_g1804 [Antrodiella citrinella]|uniref:EF-hand domain-containing protein n=1 Tax=Antrodiella citrinella TaxID=2447956 RepID=A0A4S4N0H6_9APHY|nr:hypothetical protein EUX98_g1804 [Antrodiella citrinella]
MPNASASRSNSDEIPLSSLHILKAADYAHAKNDLGTESPVDRDDIVKPTPDPSDDSDSTATNSSDEFDWDGGDDALSAMDVGGKAKAKRGRAIWSAFMKLSRSLRTILVGILGAGILITPLLVFKLRFNSSPMRIQAHVWSLWLAITWGAGCITYIIVDLLPWLILHLVHLFGHSVERLQIYIELISAVTGWLKLALDVAWMWIALSVIRVAYNPPGNYWTIVNRVMQALFSAGLLLLAEKVFLRYVAINFHRKAIAERLAENKLGLAALDRLSNAQPSASHKRNPYAANRRGHKSLGSLDILGFGNKSHAKIPTTSSSGQASTSGSPIIDKNGNGHRSTPSAESNAIKKLKAHNAERRKRKRNAVTSVLVDGLGGAIGQVALKDSKLNRAGQFGTLASAGKLARKLFSTLSDVHPARSHLVVDDFIPYFKSAADAQSAFNLFDKDGNGDITKREMREAVRRIYRERKALTASLKDVGSAVAKLDAVILACVLLILIFICLLIFNRSDTLASLVPLATIILGFSFIFGHSAQTLFESLIFIFSTHVFDVGDLVMIDDSPMFVREFGLFSTTFRRVDGAEIIAPNALLNSAKLVHNLRRSNSMWESTNLMVSYNTPLEAIEQLRIRLQGYIALNNREWSGVSVNIDKMEYQNAITLVVSMEHRPNWQDWGGRWGRRTAFMRHLKTVLEELDMKYTLPVQPVLLPRDASGRLPLSPMGPIFIQPFMDDQTPGAGPSATVREATETSSDATAPERPLPSAHFYSVEYPGYVQPASVPIALDRLGGPSHVYAAFQRSENKSGSLLELNFRPKDPFSHPVNGEVVSSNNLLLKVVKRRRKARVPGGDVVGDYTAEVVGSISKTARFRGMADYQYQPNMKDPVSVLRTAMDIDGILQYTVPEEKEDYVLRREIAPSDIDPQLLSESLDNEDEDSMRSNLRLFPPPLFSRQSVPQNYSYKANTASVVSTTVDETTGEEKKRYINRMRWKGYGPVPTKPTTSVEEQRSHADQKLLKRLQELFDQRPVWTRAAIYNQFDPLGVREIINSKFLLPLVSYVFQDGPWRDTQVRLGYDPRIQPEARLNINKPIVRPSVIGRRQDGRNEIANARASDATGRDDKRSHVFDGVNVTKDTAAFQLCDIEDEMLKEMIEDEEDLREECNERDGWYSSYAFDRIKNVLRHKFFSLLAGHVPTREECEALLVSSEGTEKTAARTTHRLRPGKHNMAKGALRWEDAAAQRLTAALDQRLKEASQRQS